MRHNRKIKNKNNLMKKTRFSDFFGWLAGAWNTVTTGVSKLVNKVVTGITSAFNWVKDTVVKAVNVLTSAYIPKYLTNFDSSVPCEEGQYKSGALCYRDCTKAGMLNCGIGACAISSTVCASSIVDMVVNTFTAIGSSVALVLSFGQSAAANAAAKKAAEEAAKKGM